MRLIYPQLENMPQRRYKKSANMEAGCFCPIFVGINLLLS
jgi:hypothetical protein